MALDITRLQAKGELVEHEGQTIRIKPLSVREQSEYAVFQAKDDFQGASKFLFVNALKKENSELTEEQILAIDDSEFISKVTKAIMKVNGFEVKKNLNQNQ